MNIRGVMDIHYFDHVEKELANEMHIGHIVYETEHNIVINYRKFSFVIRDKNQKLVGALTGYTCFEEVCVDDLWIDKPYRRKGLGKQLLNAVETKFVKEGYDNINLVTNGFQAPEFYQKCGYTLEHFRKSRNDPKLNKHFFIKRL